MLWNNASLIIWIHLKRKPTRWTVPQNTRNSNAFSSLSDLRRRGQGGDRASFWNTFCDVFLAQRESRFEFRRPSLPIKSRLTLRGGATVNYVVRSQLSIPFFVFHFLLFPTVSRFKRFRGNQAWHSRCCSFIIRVIKPQTARPHQLPADSSNLRFF